MMYYLVIADENQLVEKSFPPTEKGRERMLNLFSYLLKRGTEAILFYGNEVL